MLKPTSRCARLFGVSAILLAASAFIPIGCGSRGPEMASVSGTVTYKGAPVPMGTVTFQPVEPAKGRAATGAIQPDGSYTLQTENPDDGALVGDYRVSISARDEVVLDYRPAKPVPPKLLVPEKYEDPATSGLTATVKSGRNRIPFELN
jgi:hypothetical protein